MDARALRWCSGGSHLATGPGQVRGCRELIRTHVHLILLDFNGDSREAAIIDRLRPCSVPLGAVKQPRVFSSLANLPLLQPHFHHSYTPDLHPQAEDNSSLPSTHKGPVKTDDTPSWSSPLLHPAPLTEHCQRTLARRRSQFLQALHRPHHCRPDRRLGLQRHHHRAN